NQLDFKGSVRYNKLSRRMENFMTFKNLVFKENLFDLIANVSNFKEDKNES
ncbi:MAG: single-stranded-DNA-specific exonuclease, partial [Halanaerobium sp.]